MTRWHHRVSGREFEQTPRDGEGQGSPVCCSSWRHKNSDTTQQLNNSNKLDTQLCVCALNHVQLFAIAGAVAHQAPLSMEFSRQEYWSGWPFPPPVDLPDPGIKSVSLVSPALAGGFFTTVPNSIGRLIASDHLI